jgi:hypothetical protein
MAINLINISRGTSTEFRLEAIIEEGSLPLMGAGATRKRQPNMKA